MKTTSIITIGLIAVAFGAFPVSADACNSDGPLGLQTIETPAGTFYVDDRGFVPELSADGRAGGTWVYQETNGVPGLQSGGTNLVDTNTGQSLGGTDPCSNAVHDTPLV